MGGPVFRVSGDTLGRREDARTRGREDAKRQDGRVARESTSAEAFVGHLVRSLLWSSVLLTGAVAAVPAQGPAESARYVPPLSDLLNRRTSELRDLVERVDIDLRNLNRRWPVGYSPARAGVLRGFHSAWRTRVDEVDFGKLSQDGKVDYLLLRNGLASELSLLGREDARYTEMQALLPFAPAIMEQIGRASCREGGRCVG